MTLAEADEAATVLGVILDALVISVSRATGLAGGGCSFSDAKSSQYISAVLMAAPGAEHPVNVTLRGAITSEPYVMMTLRMMEQFGVSVTGAQVSEGQPVEPFDRGRILVSGAASIRSSTVG